ncbi:hypothetical protein ACA910_007657 [Epithemia clementina (nom. ined.)]
MLLQRECCSKHHQNLGFGHAATTAVFFERITFSGQDSVPHFLYKHDMRIAPQGRHYYTKYVHAGRGDGGTRRRHQDDDNRDPWIQCQQDNIGQDQPPIKQQGTVQGQDRSQNFQTKNDLEN